MDDVDPGAARRGRGGQQENETSLAYLITDIERSPVFGLTRPGRSSRVWERYAMLGIFALMKLGLKPSKLRGAHGVSRQVETLDFLDAFQYF